MRRIGLLDRTTGLRQPQRNTKPLQDHGPSLPPTTNARAPVSHIAPATGGVFTACTAMELRRLRVGHYNVNVADLFIVVATPLFLLAIGYSRRRSRPAAEATAVPRIRQHPRWVRIPALAAAVFLIAAVTVGAANHGGVTAPAIAASGASYH